MRIHVWRSWVGVVGAICVAACVSSADPAPAPAAADPGDRAGAETSLVEHADVPEGRGWYCGTRCGRSKHACDRASEARHAGDLEASHRQIAGPACRRTSAAYCMTYRYTLADVTETRVPIGPVPGQDRSERRGYECFPRLEACEGAADQRARRGYQLTSRCAPST